MGCEYCEKWNNENKECTANYAYRYYSLLKNYLQ